MGTTFAALIERHGLALATEQIPRRSGSGRDAKWDDTASHWRCTLTARGDGSYVFEYSMGSAWRRWKANAKFPTPSPWGVTGYQPKAGERIPAHVTGRTLLQEATLEQQSEPIAPELPNVLESLALDAASVANGETFREWCDDTGFGDGKPADALDGYNACRGVLDGLTRLIGRSGLDALLAAEEGDDDDA